MNAGLSMSGRHYNDNHLEKLQLEIEHPNPNDNYVIKLHHKILLVFASKHSSQTYYSKTCLVASLKVQRKCEGIRQVKEVDRLIWNWLPCPEMSVIH